MTTNAPIQLLDHSGDPIARSVYTRPAALSGSYKNSSRDRLRNGTRGPLGSVNAHHDKRTLDDLMRDCQQVVRNSIVAQTLVQKHIDCVVGPEVAVDPRSGDKAWDSEVQKRFADFAEVCDITGQLNLTGIAADVVKAWDTCGGKLAHKVMLSNRYLRLEMIEAVRLMNEAGRPDTRDMVGGVQVNPATGRPIKYWIADWNEQGTGLDYHPKPYDATHLWLINDPRLREAGQYRTPPRLGAFVDKIEALEVATRSTMGAYQLATFMALAFTRKHPEGVSMQDVLAQSMVNSGEANSVSEARDRGPWGPASVFELEDGEDVKQIDPKHPTTAWDAYLKTELRVICAGMGLPLELVYMWFDRSWSAHKSAVSTAWQRVRMDQQALKRQLLIPLYRTWLAGEMLAGRIDEPSEGDWRAVDFIMPSQPVLDPKLEAEAHLMALSGGLKLHSTVLQEMGQGDRDTFIERFKVERDENEKAGLAYSRPKAQFSSESVNKTEDEDGENGDTSGDA
jgi:lambda family phage portal protein